MADAANTVLTTNFNVSPYYDDFDERKNYYRVLYKPGYAVQARELTQSQTMLQKQISRLGKHIFQEGSIVIPGTFSIHTSNSIDGPLRYVKVKDVDDSGNEIDIQNFEGKKITGLTNYVEAEVDFVLDGSELTSSTKTIYIDYTKTSNVNSSIKTFQAGEILATDVGRLVVVETSPVGFGSGFRISEGVLYAKEHFIYFPTQKIIIDRYNASPTGRIGLLLTEQIINYTDDISLLDPALESSNYSAPGADRFKISGQLSVKSLENSNEDPDFVTLFVIKNGTVEDIYNRSQYNVLQDELAKRTFDESGNYYVRGLDISIREHLLSGQNGGVLASANGGQSNLLSVQISSGVGYVEGYEINKLTTSYLTTDKGLNYNSINSQIVSASMGSYVQVREFTGSWTHDQGLTISLYDVAQKRLTNENWSTGSQTGNNIGSAKLMSVEYESGTMGTPNAVFNMYLSDIKMTGSNTFSSVKSVFYNNSSTADVGADLILSASNLAVLKEPASTPYLYYVGSDFTKTLRESEQSDTTFTYKTTTEISSIGQAVFNIDSPPGSFLFPYGTSSLTSAQKREILLTINTDADVLMSGTVSNTGNNLTTSTADFSKLNAGDKLALSGISGVYYIKSVNSSTQLTLEKGLASSASGVQFKKVYKNGDVIDLTTIGANGATRTVTTTPTTLSFDLKENILVGGSISSVPATVTYRVSSTSSSQVNKLLRSDRYVKISCSTAGTTGPFNLGISDVFRIKEIRRKVGSAFSSSSEGTVVTASFSFNNGQRDTHYDHASIVPRISLGATDHLLIKLDYFEPDFTTGRGFFTVDSYPINDAITSSTNIKTEQIPIYKSPITNQEYDLRNNIDFRPIKTKTATDSTTVASASTNPATSSTFNFESNGLKFPAPFSQIIFDYDYYLSRKDVVLLHKNKTFSVLRGVPSAVPITPTIPDNAMSIGVLTIAPYPSLSLFYANQIRRQDLACFHKKTASVRFTMRDVGVLKDRIINLEKYAALTLLEKNAFDLKILDSQGIDRFKNGIFVDSFANHNLGAVYDQDYRIVVDPDEKSIRPVFNMEPIQYDFLGGVNIKRSGDIVTLNYTEVPQIIQPNVTTERNTERTTYRYIGKMTVTPSDDVFVDTQWNPDESIVFTGLAAGDNLENLEVSGMTTTWNSWQRHIAGYRVYRGSVATTENLVGTYSSALEAQAVSDSLRLTNSVTLETIFETTRTGVEQWTESGSETHSLGDKVIDVNIVPYIRPQTLKINVKGLKPFARYFTYFDDVDMTSYTRPLTLSEYNSFATTGIIRNTPTHAEGSSLIANAFGEIWCALRLPVETEKKFYIGTKQIRITDSRSGDLEDQTAFSVGYFVAQGLVQTKQETILSTRLSINKNRTVYQTGATETEALFLERVEQPPTIINNITNVTNNITQEFTEIINNITNVTNVTEVTNVTNNITNNPTTSISLEEFRRLSLELAAQQASQGEACIGYAFKAEAPKDEEGLFVTSIDLFCSQKHPTLGVWFELLETDSSGKPTQKQLPFSEVWLTNPEVPISTDGRTNPTKIQFKAPIFLENKKMYFLAIHPEAVNPNYYFWASRIGETDKNTGKPVNSRLYTGTTFTTNNGAIWDIVPDVDLTFTLYRARFDTRATGAAVLGNKPLEKFVLSNTSTSLTRYGDTFLNGDKLTLTNISGGSLNLNNFLIGQTSSSNGSIVRVESSKYTISNTGYVIGETVSERNSSTGTLTGVSATISTIDDSANSVLMRSIENSSNVTVIMSDSDGKFKVNDRIFNSFNRSQFADISKIENFRYSVIDLEPSYLNFQKTGITFSALTYSNTGSQGSFTRISPSQNYYYQNERALFSRSNEVANFSSNRTNRIRVDFVTASDFLSPVLDLKRTQSIIIDNIINSNTTNENASSGGSLINKYISKTITLAEGQDAEDMSVILTSYRPPGTDVKVWAKILHAEDSDSISNKNWIELEKKNSGGTFFSSLSNRNDFVEYSFGFPNSYLTGSSGEVQYSANTAVFTGYKYFSIKIGLLSNNSAIVPRVADLRVIALQI